MGVLVISTNKSTFNGKKFHSSHNNIFLLVCPNNYYHTGLWKLNTSSEIASLLNSYLVNMVQSRQLLAQGHADSVKANTNKWGSDQA